jgi:hypothetical protein
VITQRRSLAHRAVGEALRRVAGLIEHAIRPEALRGQRERQATHDALLVLAAQPDHWLQLVHVADQQRRLRPQQGGHGIGRWALTGFVDHDATAAAQIGVERIAQRQQRAADTGKELA